jgi:hypothetical protein
MLRLVPGAWPFKVLQWVFMPAHVRKGSVPLPGCVQGAYQQRQARAAGVRGAGARLLGSQPALGPAAVYGCVPSSATCTRNRSGQLPSAYLPVLHIELATSAPEADGRGLNKAHVVMQPCTQSRRPRTLQCKRSSQPAPAPTHTVTAVAILLLVLAQGDNVRGGRGKLDLPLARPAHAAVARLAGKPTGPCTSQQLGLPPPCPQCPGLCPRSCHSTRGSASGLSPACWPSLALQVGPQGARGCCCRCWARATARAAAASPLVPKPFHVS